LPLAARGRQGLTRRAPLTTGFVGRSSCILPDSADFFGRVRAFARHTARFGPKVRPEACY